LRGTVDLIINGCSGSAAGTALSIVLLNDLPARRGAEIVAGIVQAAIGIEAAQEPRGRGDAAVGRGARGQRPVSGRPYSYSAFQSSSTRVPDEDIDEEVAALATAVHEHGELSRDEPGRRVNCRLWGPGRLVADHARGGAEALGDLADAERRGGGHAGTASASRSACADGRSSDTNAPTTEVAASTQSAVCMLWMKGSSRAGGQPRGDAGEDREQHVLRHRSGDDRHHERDREDRAGVLQHHPRAGRDAAAVRGHDAHHRGDVGRVEHARADAGDQQPQAVLPVVTYPLAACG
jgi:hypothetical protein